MPSSGSGSASGIQSEVTYAEWPTSSDVGARLDCMGLTAPDDACITPVIIAAVKAWEKTVNYEPFLGSGNDETQYLTANHGLIDFGGGITDEPTSLTINGYYNDSGVYTDGTALVINRDYILKPINAIAKGKPYTHAKIKRLHAREEEGLVKLVAPTGYAETVPADAWEAVMEYVLAHMLSISGVSISGGLSEWHEADVMERYGVQGPIPSGVDFYNTRFGNIVWLYRRVSEM